MPTVEELDPREFRNALGHFPTGVTIVTTLADNGEKVGMTVSSFNSVSLTPPLVLWSIDKKSRSFNVFNTAEHFAIHVLSAEQNSLSTRFAQGGIDKFSGLETRSGLFNLPILPEFAACFQCTVTARHDAGDHMIMIGRVLDMESHEKPPLVFHRGQYAEIV